MALTRILGPQGRRGLTAGQSSRAHLGVHGGIMKGLTAGGVLLTGAGVTVAWWFSRRRRPEEARLVVTVTRPASDIRVDGRLPEPLERVGDSVAFDVRPAPGGRGTEIEA